MPMTARLGALPPLPPSRAHPTVREGRGGRPQDSSLRGFVARRGWRTTADRARRTGAASAAWVLGVVAVALVATVLLALRHRSTAQQQATAAQTDTTGQSGSPPVPDAIMRELANVPAAAWAQVPTGAATMPAFVGDSDMVGSKPVVLYVGAGYCPYCAAARWSMVTSLARFGTFSGLTLGSSSSVDVFPSTPTLSFHGSHYTSDYVVLQAVELAGNVRLANGRYNSLETPTPEQVALLRKYDAPPYVPEASTGGIPFILVGGRYMWSGSPFSPQLLAGRTQEAIAATLADASGVAAQAILANGNVLTAAICAVDGGQPAEVCSDPVIRRAMQALPTRKP